MFFIHDCGWAAEGHNNDEIMRLALYPSPVASVATLVVVYRSGLIMASSLTKYVFCFFLVGGRD